MSRPFAAAWAWAALLALTCGPAAAVEAVTDAELAMHLGPGAEHRSIATVPAEARLTVHGCIEAEGWCLVRFGGRHGWIEGANLAVLGFSRPPKPAAAPAAQQVVVVPVPVAPGAVHPRFATAEDVVVGIGEHTGRAAQVGRAKRKAVDLGKRHRATAAFKRHGSRGDSSFRRHGQFKPPHLDRRGFHSAGHARSDRFRFARPSVRGTELRSDRGRFVERGRFVRHGKRPGHGLHFGKSHAKPRFGKRGKSFGHSGSVRFGGLRVKGGWRP